MKIFPPPVVIRTWLKLAEGIAERQEIVIRARPVRWRWKFVTEILDTTMHTDDENASPLLGNAVVFGAQHFIVHPESMSAKNRRVAA